MKKELYYIINKPYGVLSQFSDEEKRPTLSSLYNFPKDIYPAGRLDFDSEGLLILTNDNYLKTRLLNPVYKHKRTYLIQVDGMINDESISEMREGLEINLNGKIYKTKPCLAKKIIVAPSLPPRIPPIRIRKEIPTSWIELTLIEGKNHQIRKMTAKTGFPTLRLIRTAIENLKLNELKQGEVLELNKIIIYNRLMIAE